MTESDYTPEDLSGAREISPDADVSVSDLPTARDLHTAINKLVAIRDAAGKTAKTVSETARRLSPEQQEVLFATVKARFDANMKRHQGIEWEEVQSELATSPEKLWLLNEMERTGGEPDVVDCDDETGEYLFFDCSLESPEGRRNTVYDRASQNWLAKYYPNEKCNGNAIDMADAMGLVIPEELQFTKIMKKLYKLNTDFGLNSQDWIKTPANIKRHGYELFGRRASGDVSVSRSPAGHRTVARGFRVALWV